MIARALALVALVVGTGVVSGPAACTARAATTIGVVIQSDAATAEYCVPADGVTTGLDVLLGTGADVVVQDFGADNLTVCRIDGIGCDHPTEPCFCACSDPDAGCVFWGVYTIDPGGAWTFEQVGLGQLELTGGDVLGLRWAEQTPDGGASPTVADPTGVCDRVEPVALRTPGDERGGSRGLLGLAALLIAVVLAAAAARRRRAAP